MKTFNFKAPNPFVTKTYTVESSTPGSCKVSVKGAFLGNWSFDLNLDYDLTCQRLNNYCQNTDIYIQNVFPELSPSDRENFLTNPKLNVFQN
jgi:hypothetical protein